MKYRATAVAALIAAFLLCTSLFGAGPADQAKTEETRILHIKKVVADKDMTGVLTVNELTQKIPNAERIATAVAELRPDLQIIGWKIDERPDATYQLEFKDEGGVYAKHPATLCHLVAVVPGLERRETIVEQTSYCSLNNASYALPEAVADNKAVRHMIGLLTQHTYAPVGGWTATIASNNGRSVVLDLSRATQLSRR